MNHELNINYQGLMFSPFRNKMLLSILQNDEYSSLSSSYAVVLSKFKCLTLTKSLTKRDIVGCKGT